MYVTEMVSNYMFTIRLLLSSEKLHLCMYFESLIVSFENENTILRYGKNSFIEDNTHEYVFDQLDRMQIIKRSLKEEHDKSSDIEQ